MLRRDPFFLLGNLDTISRVMSQHAPFLFKSSADLLKTAENLGIELPFQEEISILFEKFTIGSKNIPNRMTVQPMEGFDADPDGSPSELTFRRYSRFAQGGSGIIWFEATSVLPEGRSNPHQLMLSVRNQDSFKRLVEKTRHWAYNSFGNSHDVFLVLQLTHSGRYSKPEGRPKPQAAYFNPLLDKQTEDVHILSDEELNRIRDKYVEAARLAYLAGFDAIDIKACHGYLVNELLASHTRKSSRYGESFENRSCFLTEVIKNAKGEAPGVSLAVRVSAYDGIPYPYGFGVSRDGSLGIDLNEPKELVRRLIATGCSLFNVTVGNPYSVSHLGRPFDRPLPGATVPEEHPLEGVARLLEINGEFEKEFPEVPFVGTGYSWLRHFLPNVGAAVVDRGEASFIGLGRSSFAYPDAPKDLMATGIMDPKKVCITCSRCSELMRHGHISGCVVRDKEIYGREYEKLKGEME